MVQESAERLPPKNRMRRLIADLALNLHGVSVVAECATGVYAATPALAALAGAERVVCLGRDSDFGSFEEAQRATLEIAQEWDVAQQIECYQRSDTSWALSDAESAAVLNLSGVRPVNDDILDRCPKNTVVAMMFEAWEFRESDIDLVACHRQGFPVVTTNEHHPLLRSIDLVGLLAVKLLFDAQTLFALGSVAIVGSGQFADAAASALSPWVDRVLPVGSDRAFAILLGEFANIDAVVVVDHEAELVSSPIWPRIVDMANELGTRIVNVSGFPMSMLGRARTVWPRRSVPPRSMSVALDQIGSWPVIKLHAASLRAAQSLLSPPSLGVDVVPDLEGNARGFVERVIW